MRILPNTSETDEKDDDDFFRLDFFPWGVVCIFCFDLNEAGEDLAGVEVLLWPNIFLFFVVVLLLPDLWVMDSCDSTSPTYFSSTLSVLLLLFMLKSSLSKIYKQYIIICQYTIKTAIMVTFVLSQCVLKFILIRFSIFAIIKLWCNVRFISKITTEAHHRDKYFI